MTTDGREAGRFCPHCGAELRMTDFALPGHRPIMIALPCECPESVAEREREEAERLNRERAERFAAAWSRSGIPDRFLHVEADFSMVDHIDANGSVYLTGLTGRGKTHLACQLAKGYLIRHTVVERSSVICERSLRFVSSQRAMDILNVSRRDWTGRQAADYQRLLGVSLLILDDFGKGVPTEWAAENAFRLIDERHSHEKPVIFTSQYTTDALSERFCTADPETMDAMKSRLRTWCDGRMLTGPDRRVA